MAYPDLSDLKSYLNEPTDEDRHDATLVPALASAIRKVEAYTDRYFGTDSEATPKVFRPQYLEAMSIRDFHTTQDLVVEVDADNDGEYEAEWTINTDYIVGPWDQRPGYPFYRIETVGTRRFPGGSVRPTAQVTAKWGWAECPEDVVTTVLELASTIWKRRDAPFGVMGFDDLGPVKISDSDKRVLVKIDYLKRHPVLVGGL